MRGEKRDDSLLIRAIEASNNGWHDTAAALYLQAGNQMRHPKEKAELWKASEKARRIHLSD